MSNLQMVVTHLLTTNLSDQLQLLHNLALYESGDLLLSHYEKQALHDVMELSKRLKALTEIDKCALRSLLLLN